MQSCLNENQVVELVEGVSPARDRQVLDAHLDGCLRCQELVATAARALAGDQDHAQRPAIGRYELLAPIGFGGSGIVYRVRDTATGRVVALKTVATRSPSLLAAIRREIHTLARLDHPGIV